MKRAILAVATVGIVFLVSGCGGSQRNDAASAQVTSQVDQLLAKVVQVISTAGETAEPIDIGASDLPTPENKEPVPLG